MQNASEMQCKKIADNIIEFILEQVKSANADGAIFGLSGGIDSAVTAHLCKRALNKNCLALIMPNTVFTPASETDDGMLVAKSLEIPYEIKPIGHISDAFTAKDAYNADDAQRSLVIGNLNARIRANYLYYEGQKRNYLVVGTDDKSEYLIGYFTKYGDGASDILPIADLYKTQVWKLGKYLGVQDHIIAKKPSPHLWRDHIAHEELGLEYEIIDDILAGLHDRHETHADVAKKLDIPIADVEKVAGLVSKSAHKRRLQPMPKSDVLLDF